MLFVTIAHAGQSWLAALAAEAAGSTFRTGIALGAAPSCQGPGLPHRGDWRWGCGEECMLF